MIQRVHTLDIVAMDCRALHVMIDIVPHNHFEHHDCVYADDSVVIVVLSADGHMHAFISRSGEHVLEWFAPICGDA